MRSLLLGASVLVVLLASLCVASNLKTQRLPRACNEADIVQHHSFMPPLLENYWSAGTYHWDFGQGTTITNDYVRLTPNKQSREGYMWNDSPSHLSSWTAYLSFRIHSASSLGGDGFALWYTEGSKKEGGALFGHPDQFKGLGIIFDTFDNNGQKDNPGVSVIMGDGHERFRTDNDLVDQRLGGCTFNFRNSEKDDPIEAVIEYNDDTLTMSLFSKTQKQQCVQISPLTLPDGYYFGLTAHTGQLADSHDINHFVVTAAEADRRKEREAEAQKSDDEKFEANKKHFYNHQAVKDEKHHHRARHNEE